MNNEKGVSLIELLLVVVIVGIIVTLMANLPNAMGLINKSNHESIAREIASKQIEDKRAISFANLVNDNSPIADARINMLPQGAGTVSVADCPPQLCTNGESIKKVTVAVSWTDNDKPQSITLTTLIGEGGINQ